MRWLGLSIGLALLWSLLSCFANTVGLKAEENDTAFTTNILPNAETTTSGLTNSTLDGVQSGSTGALTNNSTHNGFTITCETQVSNACGSAFNGELEASHDMTVTASGSLVGIEGDSTPDNVTHTSTQIKLNGGINLSSSISVQNCEWSGSDHECGNSVGAVDSYTVIMKVLDADENVLASSTQIRTTDAGYNLNARSFDDSLHYNGVHANKYEWSWTGIDGSESTSSALRGPNLLGAEMALDFPIEDYEPLSAQEIKDMNEGLGTANLNESEIWNVISGLEESIGEKLNVETNGAVVSVEITENFEIAVTTSKEANVKEIAIVQKAVKKMKETKAVETIKKEVIAEVIKETKQEFTKVNSKISKKENSTTEKKETLDKENKEGTKTEVVSTQNKTIQMNKIMDKIDAKVKDLSKNLIIKNIVKLDAMTNEQTSLSDYNNVIFYQSKDIYAQQIEIFDNRDIYATVKLTQYINKDIMKVKIDKLNEINYNKRILLLELKELKNG